MPTWGELLNTINQRMPRDGALTLDNVRREALRDLVAHTKRPVVLYATRFLQGDARPIDIMVTLEDVQAFMEVLHGIPGPALDLILHSPGGSPMAAEAVISYVRTRFTDVRVIVPLAAMSAATMMACSADRIVMGKHSYLGPIDPQLTLQTPLGVRSVPATAIRQQFEEARKAASSPDTFAAWLPMLQQYGPDLLVSCEHAIELTKHLVQTWLAQWMFRGADDAAAKAKRVADFLAAHAEHKIHERYLTRDTLRGQGLVIDDLEASQVFQDRVLTVLHAYTHTFSMNPAIQKIVENHQGKAFIKARLNVQVQQGIPPPQQ